MPVENIRNTQIMLKQMIALELNLLGIVIYEFFFQRNGMIYDIIVMKKNNYAMTIWMDHADIHSKKYVPIWNIFHKSVFMSRFTNLSNSKLIKSYVPYKCLVFWIFIIWIIYSWIANLKSPNFELEFHWIVLKYTVHVY